MKGSRQLIFVIGRKRKVNEGDATLVRTSSVCPPPQSSISRLRWSRELLDMATTTKNKCHWLGIILRLVSKANEVSLQLFQGKELALPVSAPKEGKHRTALSTWATTWLECTCEPIARLHFNLGSESVFNHYWPFSDRRLTEELGHAMAWVAIAFKPLLVSNSVDNQNGLNCS